jgi:hypothetical protein
MQEKQALYDRHVVNSHRQRPFPPVTSMAVEVTGGSCEFVGL